MSAAEYNPENVRELLPLWLEAESPYAQKKFREDMANYPTAQPHLWTFEGFNLRDMPMYFGRFAFLYANSNGDRDTLIRASQTLGKFVNAGHVLMHVIEEKVEGVIIPAPDRGVMARIRGAIADSELVLPSPDMKELDDYYQSTFTPITDQFSAARDDWDVEGMRLEAAELVREQASLFIGFTCEVQLIATPGISSTDEDGRLAEWFPSTDVIN